MTAVVLIPLRHGRILVHVLNDVSPTYAGVIGTERDLTLLSAIRNNAHLRTAEVIVEQVLEPHSSNEKKIPTVRTTLFNIIF